MYTEKAKVEKYLTIDIDESYDAQIDLWIMAVQRYIDNYTGTTFSAPTETRYFDGNGEREMTIDHFVSITTVEILEASGDDVAYTLTEGKGEDFVIFPYNSESAFKLILVLGSTIAVWPSGARRVKVTGVWGEKSTVPEDIELAATILVSSVVEKGLKGGTIATESLGDYSVAFKDVDTLANVMDVKEILNRYKVFRL